MLDGRLWDFGSLVLLADAYFILTLKERNGDGCKAV